MIAAVIVRLLGRRLAWRLGRALYMEARGEVPNAIASNGEAALIRAVVRAAPQEDAISVWDVGANLGEWTASVAQACRDAGRDFTAHLFEPVPETQARLDQRFGGDGRISLHRIALSAEAGSGRMHIVSPTGGTNALVSGDETSAETIEVAIETGDAMRERLGQAPVDLIKIDAEGHDLDILRGLSATLAAGAAGVIQFEYNHRWIATRASLHQVFKLIDALSYRLCRVTAEGLVLLPSWNPEADRFFESNYALVREDMLTRLGVAQARWDESNVLISR